MQLPNELIFSLFSEVSSISTLLVLSSTSRLMRQISQMDTRLQVLRRCHLAAVRHVRDKPVHCMFSNDMADLRLELVQHAHRFALYPILYNWSLLPIRSLFIRGDLDLIACIKLDALFSTPNFGCNEISFTCVNFNDDENTIQFLKQAFRSCSSMRFNLCSFDQDCLVQLLGMIAGSTLRSFHFVSNFIDTFPAHVLSEAIAKAPHLRELDVVGADLGWDDEQLTTFLRELACTPLTQLSLTNNDITNFTLPTFPNLRLLNLLNNPIHPNAHKAWAEILPSCPSLTISI
ncbi:hypothetical protein DSO57_1018421 [Entomophthora muscae]|uniref:Uncharacterized protein n=1 Tax=Entomophthora muscae TaxID=34485 RepID=A0ACC2TFM4_9FUNG|nr:hypothetical protein DSO57_1018421 [Entomophthora muscae]